MSSSSTEQATLVDVEMPQLGVSVSEGTLVTWHKQVGDEVSYEETICDVATDKIDVECPSPAAGVVAELLVEPDQTVPVGTVLARIRTGGAADPGRRPRARADAPGRDPRRASGPAGPRSGPAASRAARSRAPTPPAPDPVPPAQPTPQPPTIEQPPGARVRLPGRAPDRRRAGHRPGERRRQRPPGARDQARPAARAARARGRGGGRRAADAHRVALPRGAAAPPRNGNGHHPPAPPPADAGCHARRSRRAGEPLTRVRRLIGEHMRRSLDTAAHCTTIFEADMSAVERRRARDRRDVPAGRRALRDRGAARAPGAQRLARGRSPHAAQRRSTSGSPSTSATPASSSRSSATHTGSTTRASPRRSRTSRAAPGRGELKPGETDGGTFTITNPGALGAIAATPVINLPQVAILDLEAIVKRPVVISGPDGDDVIAIRPMTNLCMSWDHRALDGAAAARFLATLRERLERV